MSATKNLSTVNARVSKAAEIISISKKELLDKLKKFLGIDESKESLNLLNAQTTTEEFLYNELLSIADVAKKPKIKIRAIAAILKGKDPFEKKVENKISESDELTFTSDVITEIDGALKVNGPIINANLVPFFKSPEQMKDRELLEAYAKYPEHEVEQELNKRAKGQHFIVLKIDTKDKREIDIETSLELLKRSRKMTVPSILPHPNDPTKIIEVYRITQLNPEDNIIELCPFCDSVMYKGYCQECNANFAGIGDEERAYVRLATHHESFNVKSMSDRKALLIDALKGLENLKNNWPKTRIRFRELKTLGNLPQLKKLRNLPSVKPADPFGIKK